MSQSVAQEHEVMARRAREFLAEAEEAIANQRFDLACFFAHQAVELYLKAVLLRLAGEYPKTYHVKTLLTRLVEVLPSLDGRARLVEFINSNKARITELDNVHTLARYSTRTYSREEAEEFVKLARDLLKLVDEALAAEQTQLSAETSQQIGQ